MLEIGTMNVPQEHHIHHRSLEDAGLDFEDVSHLSTSEVLKASFKLYGSVFAVMFVVYLLLRKRWPAAYNVLNTVDDLRTPLSSQPYGFISWTWSVFRPTDDDVFEQCGLDAVVFVRTLRFGTRVALVGMLNAIYLIPIYATAGGPEEDMDSITLGNVPEGDPCLIAATLATYVVFGSAMYLLYREFAWFTEHRHKFLARPRPDNYTVYLKYIPSHLRSNDALLDFFRDGFGADAVVDARIALRLPGLQKAVDQREAVTDKLEHARAVLEVEGTRPEHRKEGRGGCCGSRCGTSRCGVARGGEMVDSIDEYEAELGVLNARISDLVGGIEDYDVCPETARLLVGEDDLEAGLCKDDVHQSAESLAATTCDANASSAASSQSDQMFANERRPSDDCEANTHESQEKSDGAEGRDEATAAGTPPPHADDAECESIFVFSDSAGERGASESDAGPENCGETQATTCGGEVDASRMIKASQQSVKKNKKFKAAALGITSLHALRDSVHSAAGAAASSAISGAKFLTDGEFGAPRDAAFVSFSSLHARTCAVQMIQHPTPFTMNVLAAPLPKDVYWDNVGMSHKAQQLGVIAGTGLTFCLCIFWTIPVTFLSALAEVEELKKMFPFLEGWIEKMPWLEMLLAQLKPLFVVLLVALLPPILLAFAKREGHIAETTLQASLFSKLSVFLLIQIFFVQMISGTILAELQSMIEDPLSIINLLAESLPKQAKSFMQFVIVQTFLNLGIELTRALPVAAALIRNKFGPTLTEAEREKKWMGLAPLSDPPEFAYADVQANLILYYMILLVYAVMSPFLSFVMGGAFFLCSMCYRNQFLYIYPATNDTGGQLYTRFANLVMSCMIIAEVTMFGVLSLKKGAVAAILLIPLIIGTVFFNMYLKQQHYAVTHYLPYNQCVEEDLKNKDNLDFSFVRGEYVQPALRSLYDKDAVAKQRKSRSGGRWRMFAFMFRGAR